MVPIVAGVVSKAGALIHGSSAGTSIDQQNAAYQAAVAGDNDGLQFLVRSAWWVAGVGGAPNGQAADDARNKLRQLRSMGVAVGTDNTNDWRLVNPGSGVPAKAGVITPTKATPTGLAKFVSDTLQSITGRQTEAAGAAAGTAAAAKLQGTVVTVGLLVAAAVVFAAVMLRRR